MMPETLIFLFTLLAQGFVLLGVALIVARFFLRSRSAATQHHWWRGVFTGLALLPLLSLMPSLWQLPYYSTGNVVPLEPPVTLELTAPVEELAPLHVTEEEAPIPEKADFLPAHWPQWLAAVWLFGLLLIASRFAVGYGKLNRLKRQCHPLDASSPWRVDLTSAVSGCKRSSKSNVDILAGPDVPLPLVYGCLRPCLLLPSSILETSAEERRMILVHELAHVQRRDGLSHIIRCLACALHWPNPLTWIALRRLRLTEERAVDDIVLGENCHPVNYAKMLSHFASSRGLFNHSTPLHSMAQPSTVRTRVTHVLDPKQARQSPGKLLKSMLNAGILGLLFAMSTLQADDPPQEKKDDGWIKEVYAVPSNHWEEALQREGVSTAVELLRNSGITLPPGGGAIYDNESARVVLRVPRESAKELEAFFAETFDAFPRSAVAVKISATLVRVSPLDETTEGLGPAPELRGVLTGPQRDKILQAMKGRPNSQVMSSPSLVARSGQRGTITVESAEVHTNFHLSVLPHVEDGTTINLDLSLDPPDAERRTTTDVSIEDGMTVAMGMREGPDGARLTFITAEIVNLESKAGKPARTASTAQTSPSAIRPQSSSLRTVILDPGHGGMDHGSKAGGVHESRLVLDLARILRRELEDRGYEVLLTRQTDAHVTLKERTAIGNAVEDAVMIGLHFNASRHQQTRGFETYYPAPKDGQAPREPSEALARAVQTALGQSIGDQTRNRGIRRANFMMLRESNHPAILVEGAFLTNPLDLALAVQPEFQRDLAIGIANGLVNFDRQ